MLANDFAGHVHIAYGECWENGKISGFTAEVTSKFSQGSVVLVLNTLNHFNDVSYGLRKIGRSLSFFCATNYRLYFLLKDSLTVEIVC